MAINVYVKIRDAKGDTSTVTIPIPTSTSLADAALFAAAIADLIDPLVSGGIVGAGFSVGVDLTTVTTVPAAISDVQEKAMFVFRTINGFLKRLHLPTFEEGKFVPNSVNVDQSDPDVAAFITAMTEGIDLTSAGGSGVVAPVDTRGEDLELLETAIEAWGRARG